MSRMSFYTLCCLFAVGWLAGRSDAQNANFATLNTKVEVNQVVFPGVGPIPNLFRVHAYGTYNIKDARFFPARVDCYKTYVLKATGATSGQKLESVAAQIPNDPSNGTYGLEDGSVQGGILTLIYSDHSLVGVFKNTLIKVGGTPRAHTVNP